MDVDRLIEYALDVKALAEKAVIITAELSEESRKSHERTKINVANTLKKYNQGV